MKQNLLRPIALTFRVNEDEHYVIKRKMKMAGIDNQRLYLMTMALRGQMQMSSTFFSSLEERIFQ